MCRLLIQVIWPSQYCIMDMWDFYPYMPSQVVWYLLFISCWQGCSVNVPQLKLEAMSHIGRWRWGWYIIFWHDIILINFIHYWTLLPGDNLMLQWHLSPIARGKYMQWNHREASKNSLISLLWNKVSLLVRSLARSGGTSFKEYNLQMVSYTGWIWICSCHQIVNHEGLQSIYIK